MIFGWLLVNGAQRKVFKKVWRVVVGRISALKDSQHLG